MNAPRAAIFGCAGPVLGDDEAAFFQKTEPLGFILFARNCVEPGQLRTLIHALRDAIGRPDAPVLIDQEGGRVARLGPPHWRATPAAGHLARLWSHDREAARRAVWLNARLTADELAALGISVDCAPVLDVLGSGSHAIIGDRAYGDRPEPVIALGLAAAEGLLAGGICPVIKHIPGHGRGRADSHHALQVVGAPAAALEAVDFAPFAALAGMPFAMTAHITYSAFGAARPATFSASVIDGVVRGRIGFSGVLMSDDLSMAALGGSLASRADRALAAGCDLVLHCNGRREEMIEVAGAVGRLAGDPRARTAAALARAGAVAPIDRAALLAELDALLPAGGR